MNESDFWIVVEKFVDNELSPDERDRLRDLLERDASFRARFIEQVRMSVRLQADLEESAGNRIVERTKLLIAHQDPEAHLRTLEHIRRELSDRTRPQRPPRARTRRSWPGPKSIGWEIPLVAAALVIAV